MANLKEIEQWEEGIYQIEKTDPVVGGEDGVTNKPIKQLANRTLYLRKLLTEAGQQIQPKKITGASKNSVDLTGHTHEIESASTSAKGLVQLTNDTGLDSEVLALTAKAGKALAQSIAQAKLDTTNGLNKKVDKTSISDAVDSTSQTTVASSRAAKTAYDKGVEALNKANTKADSVNPILTTNKWYGDMNTVPNGTLFFAISETTKNHPHYNQGEFDAQAWQFDVGNQKIQMIFYTESDIKVRYNDDGVNWYDWTSFLTERNLSAEVNNSSNTVPASVAGVKTAYDLANSKVGFVSGFAKRYAEVFAVNGDHAGLQISRSGTSGNWVARFESLPDRTWKLWNNSDGNGFQQIVKAANGTFAFVDDITKALSSYIENSKKSNAVDSVSTDTVATSRAVKLAYDRANTANNNADGRVSKSGDDVSGVLTLLSAAGKGYYSNQLNSEAPLFIPKRVRDGYYYNPMLKGIFGNSVSGYTAAFSFGYTFGTQDASWGRGIISYLTDSGRNKEWAFLDNGDFISAGDVTTASGKSLNNHSHAWSEVTSKPSTIAGYGITDFNWVNLKNKPSTATRWPTATEQGYDQNLGKIGWVRLPSGLIFQWGESDTAISGARVNFPIAFNTCFQVFLTDTTVKTDRDALSVGTTFTNTEFKVWGDAGLFSWFAIGR